jgi:hypothetical protein
LPDEDKLHAKALPPFGAILSAVNVLAAAPGGVRAADGAP